MVEMSHFIFNNMNLSHRIAILHSSILANQFPLFSFKLSLYLCNPNYAL